MRTTTDALRSVKRYVSEILAPQPTLAMIWWTDGLGTTLRWTIHEQVKDSWDVPGATWAWLLDMDRHPPVVIGTPEVPASYYLSSQLIADPRAAAAAAGLELPASGPDVVAADAVINEMEWEVRHEFDRAEVPEDRPYARVMLASAGGTSGGALYYDVTQPMAIECYPQPLDTASASHLQAVDVLGILEHGFRGAGVAEGRPLRIPLYDYDGIAPEEGATERHPNDFLRVLDFSGRPLPHPQDPRRVAAVVDLRVGWSRATDLRTVRDREDMPIRGTRQVQSVTTELDVS